MPTEFCRCEESNEWKRHRLTKDKAKIENKYQAKHKERYLFYSQRDEGIRLLFLKYKEPPSQIDVGVPAPNVSVVRKLVAKNRAPDSDA